MTSSVTILECLKKAGAWMMLDGKWGPRHDNSGDCIAAIMIFWARTNDGRSAVYALLVLGAVSTVLVLEMEDGTLIWEVLNRVLIEFFEVGGAAVILVLAWATITTFIRARRRTRLALCHRGGTNHEHHRQTTHCSRQEA